MDEITEVGKDSAQATDQTSTGEKESTSKTPRTYTEEAKNKAISDALAEQGRKHKAELEPITQERNTLRTQAEKATKEAQEATTSLEETRQHVTALEGDIEVLEENDTDPNKLSRLRRELRAEKINVKQGVKDEQDAVAELRKALDAERLEWAETVAEAQTFKFDGELTRLVDEYEGSVSTNFTKLKTACDKAGIKTKEGAEAIAELSFTKKEVGSTLVGDSGVTSGGGLSFERIRDAMIKNPSNDKIMQRYLEAKKARDG